MHTIELRIDGKLRLALVFCTYSKNYLPSVLRLPLLSIFLAPPDGGAGVRWTPDAQQKHRPRRQPRRWHGAAVTEGEKKPTTNAISRMLLILNIVKEVLITDDKLRFHLAFFSPSVKNRRFLTAPSSEGAKRLRVTAACAPTVFLKPLPF